MLYVKLKVAPRRSMTIKKVSRNDSLVKMLEKEAYHLQGEILTVHDRKKREIVQRAYNKVISRIEEIRNPSPLRLTRYE